MACNHRSVFHMLDFSSQTQINFHKRIDRGGLQIFELKPILLDRIIKLTKKFNDVPMDLADASLVVVSEETGYSDIVTLDADFYVYRDIRNQYLTNVFNQSLNRSVSVRVITLTPVLIVFSGSSG